jgi:hypothetical protein
MAESDNPIPASPVVVASQPGSVISPGGLAVASPAPNTESLIPQTPPPAQPLVLSEEEPTPSFKTSGFSTSPLNSNSVGRLPETDDSPVTWTASEFIAHDKSAGWYALLGLGSLALAALTYLVTRDLISTVVIIVAALALGAFASRQPRQLQYSLEQTGLRIGERFYSYELYRSFAVVPEGVFSSIVFMPLKRFAPLTTIYFDPADEDRIIDVLEPRMPLEDYNHDLIDRFMRQIRF